MIQTFGTSEREYSIKVGKDDIFQPIDQLKHVLSTAPQNE